MVVGVENLGPLRNGPKNFWGYYAFGPWYLVYFRGQNGMFFRIWCHYGDDLVSQTVSDGHNGARRSETRPDGLKTVQTG